MHSPIRKAVLAIVLALAIVFMAVQYLASSDGDCSTDSLGTTSMAPAAFSASHPVSKGGGTSTSNGGKKVKVDGHGGGFFSIFIIYDNDCD